jgi:hypothetical protein
MFANPLNGGGFIFLKLALSRFEPPAMPQRAPDMADVLSLARVASPPTFGECPH